jgi:hypothetical protein
MMLFVRNVDATAMQAPSAVKMLTLIDQSSSQQTHRQEKIPPNKSFYDLCFSFSPLLPLLPASSLSSSALLCGSIIGSAARGLPLVVRLK